MGGGGNKEKENTLIMNNAFLLLNYSPKPG